MRNGRPYAIKIATAAVIAFRAGWEAASAAHERPASAPDAARADPAATSSPLPARPNPVEPGRTRHDRLPKGTPHA